jgi:hypothetical protein
VSEGVYVSEEHRARKRRRIAGLATGAAAVVAVGTFAAAIWFGDRDGDVVGEPGALAPMVSAEASGPAMPSAPASTSAAPSVGIGPATKAAQRQSSTPSPVPSLMPPPGGAMTDDQIASAQISQLLQPKPVRSGVGVAASGERVTIRNEVTPDGANVRVVSARYDVTGSWKLLWAGDDGHFVDGARCTRNVRAEGQLVAQVRPGMLLCWRTSAGKSVVAVATGASPQESFTAAVVAREWANLG